MNTYEKIRTSGGKVAIIKNPREINLFHIPCLTGTKVSREGDSIFENADGPYTELVVFALGEIKWRKPMVMSNHYGELVYMNGKL